MIDHDHERIEELLSARALGGLEAGDEEVLRDLMAAHGACDTCRSLEAECAEAAGRLAYALAPAELRAGFEDEVVARATGGVAADGALRGAVRGDRPDAAPPVAAPPVAAGTRAARHARPARSSPWKGFAAAAAAAALFVGGWFARDVAGTPEPALAGVRVVAFRPAGGEAEGDLAVAYRPASRGAFLFGSGLRALQPGRVLEVWMISGDRVARGPCLRPAPDGSLATFVDAELGSTSTMAVTVEPESCPTAPTTDPILTADLRPRTS